MRELDVLLHRYLDESWPRAEEGERAAFRELLELQDPDLAAYLLGNATPPASLEKLIARLQRG
jgi:antitoxin CptB